MKKSFLWVLVSCLVMGLLSCAKQKEKEVVILSVNDMHASIDMFPQLGALVDSLRAVYPDLLLFSGGDNRTGNPVNDQYDPTSYPMAILMKTLGFDASATGNHEFDAGLPAFQKVIELSEFPYLCANINIPDSVKLDVIPATVIENQGLKIGLIGVVEVSSNGLPSAHPSNLTQVSFVPAPEMIGQYAGMADTCDLVFLLSHCGFEEDVELTPLVPFVDVIIGGHSHTLVENTQIHNGVLVTQAGSKLGNVVMTKVKVVDGKVVEKTSQAINLKEYPKKNLEIQALVDQLNDSDALKVVLATAEADFETYEQLGCMMTDGERYCTGADFAFQNTGGVRIPRFPAGPITVKDVYTIDPFENHVIVYRMTGEQLVEYIKDSYRGNGNTPSYVSGMSCVVKADAEGNPVDVIITPDGKKFDLTKEYVVAMNSYMASTTNFESLDGGNDTYRTSEDMMMEYLRAKGTVNYAGVSRVGVE